MAPNWYLNNSLYCPDDKDSKVWNVTPALIGLARRGYLAYLIALYTEDEKPCALVLVPDEEAFHLCHCSYFSLFPEEDRFSSLEGMYSFIAREEKIGNLKELRLRMPLEELKNRLVLDKAVPREIRELG